MKETEQWEMLDPDGRTVHKVSATRVVGRWNRMRCKGCLNDLGYRAGMYWPSYKSTCKIGKVVSITKDGYLYNRKCSEKKSGIN